MKNNIYYIFTSISFALLIAAPGRFAFGIIIGCELLFLIFSSLFFSFISKRLKLNEFNSVISVTGIVFATICYKLIVSILFPLIALQMSFVFYLPAVSAYIIGIVFRNLNNSTKQNALENLKITVFFVLFTLVFYLIRDIAGYGTFTVPGESGLIEKIIFSPDSFSWCTFFASIPGALVLVSIAILVFIFVHNKLEIVERTKE